MPTPKSTRKACRRQLHPLVRASREKTGMTQADYATLLGVSKESIISLENGRMGLSDGMWLRIQRVEGNDLRAMIEVKVNAYRRKLEALAGLSPRLSLHH